MNTVEMEVAKQLLQAERDELEAAKLELQADRAEFKAEKLEWQLTKGGSASNCLSDRELKEVKAKLEAERLQLEAEKKQLTVAQSELKEEKEGLKANRLQLEKEKTQLRVAQSQLKAAQSQLEAAKSQLETAQTQLERAREQLEIAREHLEAAKAQTDIDNIRLEAAKASLGAAKMRFEAATKQLNDAKSGFEAAKTRLDLASSSIEAEKSQLKDDKAALEIKVSEVESEKAKLEIKISQLENEKIELGYDLRESKAEAERLLEKMKGVEKQLDQCCKDRKALQDEKSKHEVQPANNNEKRNPKVFLDISINGSIAGRVVIELDVKTTPITVENFRALCTEEKGIGQSGKPLHYKGSTFWCFKPDENLCRGGDITHKDDYDSGSGESIYGGDRFPIENYINKHSGPGIVSMVYWTQSKMSHGSQFFITTAKRECCDGINVAFGHVVEGMDVVMAMRNAGSGGAKCVIAECGQLS